MRIEERTEHKRRRCLPSFQFDKVSGIARNLKAFLNPQTGSRRATASDIVQPEAQTQNTSHAQRHTSEYKKKVKNRDPPLERIETAQLRQLPDFVIIGTQRGGTTSLYRYLTEHPDISGALRKEVHFFDRYYEKGMDWYLANFPVRGEAPVVGEASPYYLFHPDVPERVRRALPHAKFIVLLRNPVDRAYSHYQMVVRRGIETFSFEEAIDKERERLSGNDDPVGLARRHYSYIKRGLYVDQLKRWMNVFPREQFLIIKSEDFYENPERILHQTLAYLGLCPWSPANFRVRHQAEYADMNPVTRKRLEEYFAPYNRQLYTFLGRDLEWEHERQ
jgi:hypothetical protein